MRRPSKKCTGRWRLNRFAHDKVRRRKRAKISQAESIYDYLRENPVSLLTSIVRTTKWLTDPNFRFIRLDDKHLQRAIQVFNDEMCSYTTLDFIDMYNKALKDSGITIPSRSLTLRTAICTAFI